jgi:hypothetical protein
MQLEVTEPFEDFIKYQLSRGYADANEIARQAFLRWMEEDEFDPDPPRLREKVQAAQNGTFQPYRSESYDALLKLNEPAKLRRASSFHATFSKSSATCNGSILPPALASWSALRRRSN